MSGHLGVVEAAIHPAARRRLPRARATVAEQRARARRIERLMRLIQGRFHGDSHADGSDVLSLQRDLLEHVDAYAASERARRSASTTRSSVEHRRALVAQFDAAMADPPTRPHPFAPHPTGFARLVMRVCTLWDHVMDEMDNRSVAGQHGARDPRQLSRWDRYFLGTPQFDETAAAGPPRVAAPTAAAAADQT